MSLSASSRPSTGDVHRAAELVLARARGPPPPPPRPLPIEPFDIDDSEQHQPVAPRTPPWSFSFSNLLVWAVSTTFDAFPVCVGVLRIPCPARLRSISRCFRPRRAPPRGDGGADRWVRELEEETGAQCMSASGVDAGTAGPSTLTHRTNDRKDALRVCQRDTRIACIVLVSEEHDDVPEFKRTTLTDPTLVRLLHANNILVWGGDVRDREAHSAALKLQATTYPFVAFLALQPRRGSRASSTPTLTGPPSSTTSPATLAAHLETQLLPRVQAVPRGAARGAAYGRCGPRVERGAGPRVPRLTRARRGRRRRRGLRRRRRRRVENGNAAEREKRARERGLWRRWSRRALQQDKEDAEGVRLAIRLPDGGRVVRRFAESRSLTALYAFVDAQLADGEGEEVSPEGHGVGELERSDGGAGGRGGPGRVLVVQMLATESTVNGDADDDGYVSED
ncbi:hypothetical protein B0H11DRAFT_2139231 [Mycena galericulata]|nr:hypothetical protein B0H11DRAFT_2139231 [Mycena galericulata]